MDLIPALIAGALFAAIAAYAWKRRETRKRTPAAPGTRPPSDPLSPTYD